jgi:hypothetical protein
VGDRQGLQDAADGDEKSRHLTARAGAWPATAEADKVLAQLDFLRCRQGHVGHPDIRQFRIDGSDVVPGDIPMLGLVFLIVEHQVRAHGKVGFHGLSPNDFSAKHRS